MSRQTAADMQSQMPVLSLQDLIVDLLNSLSTLKTLSEINCEAYDEKELIKQALSSLIHNQDMERCSFFVVDEQGILTNVTGLSADQLDSDSSVTPSLQFRVGEGIIGAAAATGEIQNCQNCKDDKRFAFVGDRSKMPGSIISVPIFTLHKALIGVLNISHPQAYFFGEWHLRLLEVFKNILGQLITNFRLFRQMEAQIVSRTAELARLVVETSQLKDHYASMAMHDQLTGLNNRRYFYEQVEIAVAQHKRYKYPCCLLVMDIDHFKSVNDCYGHVLGDQVLIRVADTLKNQVRSTDILARFGGEEFVVIFTNVNAENGKTFAERIRNEIKSLSWHVNGVDFRITISIGLYCLSLNNEQVADINIDQIIHCADTALYKAKANGRDQVVVF